jgi:hypothetical protein
MKADVTYRIAPQNRITRLRVRLKVVDGRSAVVNFDSPAAFLKRAETVDAELAEIFYEDLNVLADLEKQVHYRLDLDISASAMKEMGFPELGEPCDFEISFTKVPDEAHPNQLVAREVNSPVFPLIIKQNFTQQGLAERVGRIGFAASEVRDAGMNGSASKRRITEDEVEILFDPTKTVEKEEAEDLGFSMETCKSMR